MQASKQEEKTPCFGMHSPLSLWSFLLPQAWFPTTHLPAAVEVAATEAGPLLDVPAGIGPPGSPGADTDIARSPGGRLLVPRLPEGFTAMRLIAAHIEAQPMVWVRQR